MRVWAVRRLLYAGDGKEQIPGRPGRTHGDKSNECDSMERFYGANVSSVAIAYLKSCLAKP